MNDLDERLLNLYLSFEDAEAGPWNRSPECLYLEYWSRAFVRQHLRLIPGVRVCNVGIGAGGWDNFLCDLIGANGRLTSVDINVDICALFEYRQKREGHPNPATVVCADILSNPLPAASFDAVTVIGSTVTESGDYDACLSSCWRLVRESGFMMYMDFFKTPYDRFEAWAKSHSAMVEDCAKDTHAEAYAFWVKRGKT